MDRGGIRRMADVDAETAGAWAEGWLAADDRPVADVLAELNRYRAVPVRFDPAALAGVRVSGSFRCAIPIRRFQASPGRPACG
jgi:transmembrane sensor